MARTQRTRVGRMKMFLVLLVCAAPVLASYWMYYIAPPEGRTNYSTLIQPSRALPNVSDWRDLQGQAITPAALKGQWLLIAVGPGRCETACEQRLYLLRQLRETLGRDRDRLDKVWIVTDTGSIAPALLAAITASPATTVLRVPEAQVAAWLQPAAGQALGDHLYIVDPLGEWMMRVPPQVEPDKLKRDLQRLMRGSAGWDKAGR